MTMTPISNRDMRPLVSIIIPTYNRAVLLEAALRSALDQDYDKIEVIVSDNASTDETPEVVRRYANDRRVQYRRNEQNVGMVQNWRKAVISDARGDWFILLSDDDYFIDANYITKAVDLIVSNPDMVLVYADGIIMIEGSHHQLELRLPFDTVTDGKTIFLSRGTVLPQDFTLCNVIFKRSLALSLDPFANPCNLSCDSELFLKVCLQGKVGVIHDLVSVYRRHASNLIETVDRNVDLLINNIDCAVGSYSFARSSHTLSTEELSAYRKRVVVPTLNHVLLQLIFLHDKPYGIARQMIQNKLEKDNLSLLDDVLSYQESMYLKLKKSIKKAIVLLNK